MLRIPINGASPACSLSAGESACCSRFRRALTLVETAALVTLFAVLSASLLASTRSTRQQDRLAGCLSNLRAIGAASTAYSAADPNETFIPIPDLSVLPNAIGEFEWGGRSGRGDALVAGDVTSSYWGTRNFRGPGHRPLNVELYKTGINDWNPVGGMPMPGPGGINFFNDTKLDLDRYRCPADTGYAGGGFAYTAGVRPQFGEVAFRAEEKTAYDHFGTSYNARTFYITGGTSGNRIRSQSAYWSPVSALANPGSTLAYSEVPARYVWVWGDWSDPSCSWTGRQDRCVGNFNIVPGWHQQDFGFTAAFADGRAAILEMKGCFRPSPHLGLLNFPPTECGPSFPPYECFQCVIVRGPGWQIDSFPAPPVVTPWISGSGARSDGHDEQRTPLTWYP